MGISCSPLRYPGGKQILARVLAHLIRLNAREGGIYAEPYAGGAGAALNLLVGEFVERLILNDADPSIYAFWWAALRKTDAFLKLLRDTPINVEEWQRQREIYLRPARHSQIKLGFATFYLNRCNRSGIIGNAGCIGGREQSGKWKLDARFNRRELTRRIERLALYADRIELHNLDAVQFLDDHINKPNIAEREFVYLDPPYFVKGSQLYLNYYKPDDHQSLSKYLERSSRFLWVMSYDDVPEIRKLYRAYRRVAFNLGYSARERRDGQELLILRDGLVFPKKWASRIPDRYISSSGSISIPLAG